MTGEMGTPDREIDLDIVSASWRSLTTAEGYDQMIAAWDRKIAKAGETGGRGLLDRVLSRQLLAIDTLLTGDLDLKVEDPIEEAVRAMPAPAMVLSPEGTIVALGHGGAEFFGVGQGQQAGRDWLHVDSRESYDTIRRNATDKGGNSSYAVIRTLSADGSLHLAEVYSLQVESHTGTYTVVRSLELEWFPEVGANLMQAFGLTEAETEICRLLFRLRDPQAISRERGVSIQTIRTQLKAIFSKTEMRSKVDLIRMLGLVCARAAMGREARSMDYVDPLGNETIFYRANRKRLAYSWCGAEDGAPVLFVHGLIPHFALQESTRAALIERGLKLICISMPGHGNSDTDDTSSQIDDGTAAIIELCDNLDLRGIAGLATYSGQFGLTRAAAQRPDLFDALMIIGMPWNLSEDRQKRLPLSQRTFAQIARTAPVVFDLICRIGFRRAVAEGPDFYMTRAYGESAIDAASILDPELQSLLRPACRHLMNQGHEAFARETLMLAECRLGDWIADVNVPIHYVLPDAFENATSADLADLTALNKSITVEIVPDAGELIVYQKPDLLVERLVDAAAKMTRYGFVNT